MVFGKDSSGGGPGTQHFSLPTSWPGEGCRSKGAEMTFYSQEIERVPNADWLNALVAHSDHSMYLSAAAEGKQRASLCGKLRHLSTSRRCKAAAMISAGDQTYVWEDHTGSTVEGGLKEKIKTTQKAIALIWRLMMRI